MNPAITRILDDTVNGRRLAAEDALHLLESRELAAIGRAAHAISKRMHPEPWRTYNIDRNINYTNICTAVCDFCAFYRAPKHAEGYVLDRQVLLEKIEETVALGGDQILMQGGLHPNCRCGRCSSASRGQGWAPFPAAVVKSLSTGCAMP